jgi:hypothetical protein
MNLTLTIPESTQPPITVEVGGTTELTSYVAQVAGLPDYPATFPPAIGSAANQAVAGNDPRLTNERAPSPHTHPLADLTGVTPAAIGAMANTTAALDALIAASPATAREAAQLNDPLAIASKINSQPIAMSRIAAWTFGGASPLARPLCFAVVGDSYATGLDLPANASPNGVWTIQPLGARGASPNGVYTGGDVVGAVARPYNRFDLWINGAPFLYDVGSSSSLVSGGAAGDAGYVEGDTAAIAYVKRYGGGTFDLQYWSSVGAAWTTLATIDTSLPGASDDPVGVYAEYALPTTFSPSYKLRVFNVVTGQVAICFAGVFSNTAGGAMLAPVGALNALAPENLLATPITIVDPIWTGLKPDAVLACWFEEAEDFEAGGYFRQLYDRLDGYCKSDWIMVGRHPSSVSDAAIAAGEAARRQWAVDTNQSYINVHEFFKSLAHATATGMMSESDTIHLTAVGGAARNYYIWSILPLGFYPLGSSGAFSLSKPVAAIEPTNNAVARIDRTGVSMPRTLTLRSALPDALVIADRNNLRDRRKFWGVGNNAGVLGFSLLSDPFTTQIEFLNNHARFKFGMSVRQRTFTTATVNLTSNDYSCFCDASAAAQTVNLVTTSAAMPNRIHVFKKIDSSANTVTIDPAGSETIDGATTVVLANRWDYIVIQSDGSNWFKIGGNV